MHILVINSGSSSVKFSLFESSRSEARSLFEGEIAGVGGEKAEFHLKDAAGNDLSGGRREVDARTTAEAIELVAASLTAPAIPVVEAVGYRVVHPGPKLDRHVRIDQQVLEYLEAAIEFAPLHDPAAIEVIRRMMARFPDINHYACFDTVFHQTMPEVARTYPIPLRFRERGVRRYGFHGLSCESIVKQLRAEKGLEFPRRLIIAHLGSGCSVTAVDDGRSVDTTMGLTPTGGVVMGTRPGDLDPGLVLYLLRQMEGDKVSNLERMLNHDAGIEALSGLPNDMKTLRAAAAKGDAQAKLAISVFTRSVKKAIGAFAALLGGCDCLVFTGGIGEHDSRSREEIVSGLEFAGFSLHPAKNEASGDAVRRINAFDSTSGLLVVPAREDWMIAIHVHQLVFGETS